MRRASHNVQHAGAVAVDRYRAERLKVRLHHDAGEVGNPFLQSWAPLSSPLLLIALPLCAFGSEDDEYPAQEEKEG